MSDIAQTPEPPYYAVIFSNHLTSEHDGYDEAAKRMMEMASEQPGFLGAESVRDGLGITVSYWESLDAIDNWKRNAEHREAQKLGREQWYATFKIRVARVERDHGM
jgi:heme-degrading monooxygenase HmoA